MSRWNDRPNRIQKASTNKKTASKVRGAVRQARRSVKQLKDSLKARTHDFAGFATKDELKAVEAKIPKPYVHPTTGICPQEPKKHKHVKEDIVNLEVHKPYDFEQLKKDHPITEGLELFERVKSGTKIKVEKI